MSTDKNEQNQSWLTATELTADNVLPFDDYEYNVRYEHIRRPANGQIVQKSRRYAADQIRDMRSLRAQGMTYEKIARQFECSNMFVRNVCLLNVYKDVQ